MPAGKTDALLLPMDTALVGMTEAVVTDNQANGFCHGQAALCQIYQRVSLKFRQRDNRFIGIGEHNELGQLKPKRGLSKID